MHKPYKITHFLKHRNHITMKLVLIPSFTLTQNLIRVKCFDFRLRYKIFGFHSGHESWDIGVPTCGTGWGWADVRPFSFVNFDLSLLHFHDVLDCILLKAVETIIHPFQLLLRGQHQEYFSNWRLFMVLFWVANLCVKLILSFFYSAIGRAYFPFSSVVVPFMQFWCIDWRLLVLNPLLFSKGILRLKHCRKSQY
jgi:hypothetical protein